MLYNFHDSPADLFHRMVLNVHLNEELGIRIYSFQCDTSRPDLPDRSHIGPKWNRYFLRSIQIILQATHGVVSGDPEFYKAAFGSTQAEFDDILSRPHHMIFNRHWYERHDGRGELNEFQAELSRLSASEKAELLSFLIRPEPGRIRSRCRDATVGASRDRAILLSAAEGEGGGNPHPPAGARPTTTGPANWAVNGGDRRRCGAG